MLVDTAKDGVHCGQLLKSRYGTQDTPTVFQEIEADTQFAKMFVKRLGQGQSENVPEHFGHGRESHKATEEELDEKLAKMILDMVSASVVQDKKTPKECDGQRI